MALNRVQACLKGKCPNCEKGNVYEKSGSFSFSLPKMKENCDECGHRFLKEPGFFYGAMYVSYGLAIAIAVAAFVICQFFFENVLDLRMFGIIATVVVLFSVQNYKLSRLIWMYMFTRKRKLVD